MQRLHLLERGGINLCPADDKPITRHFDSLQRLVDTVHHRHALRVIILVVSDDNVLAARQCALRK